MLRIEHLPNCTYRKTQVNSSILGENNKLVTVNFKPHIRTAGTTLHFSGAWVTRELKALPQNLPIHDKAEVLIDANGIKEFDSAGALLINQYLAALQQANIKHSITGLKSEWQELINLVAEHPITLPEPKPQPKITPLAFIGEETILRFMYFFHFLDFIGRITAMIGRICKQPKRFHIGSIVNTIDQAGLRSLPIVGLLCFLIGVVLAYQLGMQLKSYGANIFIVYLTGVAILREFGPLIAAIILAGRTSSAFTAEIGTMKVNQEIDAIMTMGLYPSEFLVVPKIIGLLLIFPLLIFWADIFGVIGSMFMAKVSMGISCFTFLHQFADSVEVKQLFIGLSKAPAFALIIAIVGCYQGFQVEHSADSVGRKTTKSVVQAIFLIIIADAAFSVLYSALGL